MILPLRVIFGDTDQMGVVYYANYLRYFEAARAEYWRQMGRSYRELEAVGVGLPVVEAHCNYKKPALYEDLLQIECIIDEQRSVQMRFAYRIWRNQTLLADGFTRHAVVRARDGRPVPLPAEFRDMMKVEAFADGAPTNGM